MLSTPEMKTCNQIQTEIKPVCLEKKELVHSSLMSPAHEVGDLLAALMLISGGYLMCSRAGCLADGSRIVTLKTFACAGENTELLKIYAQ